MALLLLASTTSWKVEKHFCMGRLVDMAFFVDAQDCGMDMVSGPTSGATIDRKSCCEDQVTVIGGQNDVRPSFADIDVERQLFLVAYMDICTGLFEPIWVHTVLHERYVPPKIVENIQLLDNVFLI